MLDAGVPDRATNGREAAVRGTELSDDTLMQQYCAGDASAFDALYRRYRIPVYRFFQRQLPTPDAEECHQEVWLKLISSRLRYEPRGQFRAYLFTIAHHALTDRHRRMLKHGVIDQDAAVESLPDASKDLETAVQDSRLLERMQRCIAALPVAQREAFLMKEVGGLSLAEIALATGSAEESVKSRLRYAMQKLRRALRES